MIVELYGELQNLLDELDIRQGDLADDEASALCDRIIEIEDRISSLPATNIEEAWVKLQVMSADVADALSVEQRDSMSEILDILRSEIVDRAVRTLH